MGGYVYLIKQTTSSENYYKIGCTRSNNIVKRLKQLQTGNPNELSLEMSYHSNNPFKLEKMLHQRLGANRQNGEWFYLDENTVADFKSLCDTCQKIIDSLADNPFFSKKTETSHLI